jgi:hypothetical protein
MLANDRDVKVSLICVGWAYGEVLDARISTAVIVPFLRK